MVAARLRIGSVLETIWLVGWASEGARSSDFALLLSKTTHLATGMHHSARSFLDAGSVSNLSRRFRRD